VTRKLYFDDSYALEFEAPAAPLVERPGATGVVLPATFFYPTSGGQPFDTGALGAARVVDVVEEDDGGIFHRLEGDPGAGPWKARIDAARRLDHMQQHTGQHLLSAAFVQALRAPTVSFHLGEETCTIDVELSGTARVGEAEALANQVIAEGREVRAFEVDPSEVEKLGLRKPPAARERIRVVEVADFDRSACGGTHVRRTSEVQLVKVLGVEKVREQARVEFVCGLRALRDYGVKHELLKGLAAKFTTAPAALGAALDKRLDEAAAQRRALEKLEQELAAFEADSAAASAQPVGGARLLVRAVEGRSAAYLRALSGKLKAKEGLVFALGTAQDAPAWIFGHGPGVELDLRPLWKEWCAAVGAKGGGQADLVQGGGLAAGTAAADALERAASALRAALGGGR